MTFFRIEKKPFLASRRDYLAATRRKNGVLMGEGSVIHPIGKDEVCISNYGSTGSCIRLRGREAIAHARDALIKICEMQKIP